MALKRKTTPRSSFLDKVLGRLDRLDSEGLQSVVQRLARERAFLETLFNSIEDGVVVVDSQGRIVYFNAVATRLIGLPEEGCEGEEIVRFLQISTGQESRFSMVRKALGSIVKNLR